MDLWKPSASLEHLKARAQLLAYTREYFSHNDVLEVETPLLCQHGVTDRHMQMIQTASEPRQFLQTSPEYGMKRLLCSGSGSIFQICKAFRANDKGHRHNPEFTLLEWYRVDFELEDLMADVFSFLGGIFHDYQRVDYSYQQVFQEFLGIDPLFIQLHELEVFAKERLGDLPEKLERDDYLSLLFEHSIEPYLGRMTAEGIGQIAFIYDYPASQAALARIHPENPAVAKRFEVYLEGVELANGFHELADAQLQRERFEEDNLWRMANGLEAVEIDEHFLAALESGLPNCSGVALGLDRLLMIALGVDSIDEVIAFADSRA